MADETPKTTPVSTPKTPKPATKRLSKGFRKYLRRKKEAARKPYTQQ
ncbi:MAG: hypothetical protein KF753_25085 [Caldilineaceae bacterium]|nr:hypothetical protein [Caldilineaceae bacterium]